MVVKTDSITSLRLNALDAHRAAEARSAADKAMREADGRDSVARAINEAFGDTYRHQRDWESDEAGVQIAVIDDIRFRCLSFDLEALVSCPSCGSRAEQWRMVPTLESLGYWLAVVARHCEKRGAMPSGDSAE